MREIIQIQVGQCGNQIGTQFWEKLCQEHEIDFDGFYKGNQLDIEAKRCSVYFQRLSDDRFVPRSINVDLEPATMDSIRTSAIGNIFRPDNNIHGHNGAGNNFAKGHYTEGAEVVESVLEAVRKEVESCDCFQGLQFAHSVGGGTGSGLGCLLIRRLKEEYCDRLTSSFSVIPSPKVSDTVVEPYNAILSLQSLADVSDMSYCMDNEALYNICSTSLKIPNPSYTELNSLLSTAMSGITTTLRFPGQLNADLRKLATNMIPNPHLHFFITSNAPLSAAKDQGYRSLNVVDLTQQLFDSRNMMAACDYKNSHFLTVATIYRGMMSIKEVEDQMFAIQNNPKYQFIKWIPNNSKTALCNVPLKNCPVSATCIANNTCISTLFTRILDQFDVMLKKNAFIHWYIDEGMAIEEFENASAAVRSVVDLYQAIGSDDFDGQIE